MKIVHNAYKLLRELGEIKSELDNYEDAELCQLFSAVKQLVPKTRQAFSEAMKSWNSEFRKGFGLGREAANYLNISDERLGDILFWELYDNNLPGYSKTMGFYAGLGFYGGKKSFCFMK